MSLFNLILLLKIIILFTRRSRQLVRMKSSCIMSDRPNAKCWKVTSSFESSQQIWCIEIQIWFPHDSNTIFVTTVKQCQEVGRSVKAISRKSKTGGVTANQLSQSHQNTKITIPKISRQQILKTTHKTKPRLDGQDDVLTAEFSRYSVSPGSRAALDREVTGTLTQYDFGQGGSSPLKVTVRHSVQGEQFYVCNPNQVMAI